MLFILVRFMFINSYSAYLLSVFLTFTEESQLCLTLLALQFSHLRCVPDRHFSLSSAALEITRQLGWWMALMYPRRKCQATPSLSKLSEVVEVESRSSVYSQWAREKSPLHTPGLKTALRACHTTLLPTSVLCSNGSHSNTEVEHGVLRVQRDWGRAVPFLKRKEKAETAKHHPIRRRTVPKGTSLGTQFVENFILPLVHLPLYVQSHCVLNSYIFCPGFCIGEDILFL